MTAYRIATSVLEGIVRGSLAADSRIRIHSSLPLARARAIEVLVEGDKCEVVVHVDARLGEVLPTLATEVRTAVAGALGRMTGLTVGSVDVIFAGVFPAGA
ncbi:MAG TPA: Asp23/Gls24 family envelope stress response protein [Thermoleophilia bacterium]|nr:Asp23/Gls24 family envelope stress response protein [Thermoleophilia bacterium]